MNMLYILRKPYRNVVYIYTLCKISFNLNECPSSLNFRSVFSIRNLLILILGGWIPSSSYAGVGADCHLYRIMIHF